MTGQSRKKRQRCRRRELAEAIAYCPKTSGGWGQGLEVSRSDLLLVRRAIREGWPVSAEAKRFVVADVCRVFDTTQSPRMLAAAAWAVVAMEGANQRAELTARFQPAG